MSDNTKAYWFIKDFFDGKKNKDFAKKRLNEVIQDATTKALKSAEKSLRTKLWENLDNGLPPMLEVDIISIFNDLLDHKAEEEV